MFKKLLHLLRCQPGKLLWDGPIEVTGKKNHEGYSVKGFEVWECGICHDPIVVMKKEIKK